MDVILAIGYLSILFAGGSLIAKLAEKFGIPDIPLLLIFGLLISFFNIIPKGIVETSFEFIGNFGLIILLFIGSYEMEWDVMKKVLGTIVKLDVIALLVVCAISGIVFNWVFHLPLLAIIGFLFGAIVCATDPATLIPIFSKMNMNPEVAITLEAESVFNDPLGIVVALICLSAMGLAASENPILEFSSLAVGGIILGLIAGKFYEIIVSKIKFGDYIAPFTLGLCIAFWYFAEGIFPQITGYEISGFMAAAIMGLYIGNTMAPKPGYKKEMERVSMFFGELSTFIRILIFVLLGAGVSISLLENYAIPATICALGSILLARPIGVLIATSIPPARPFLERIYIALEGPRGVVPATMSAMVYSEIMNNPSIVPSSISKYMPPTELAGAILVATFATIIISVILEASWAKPLAKVLLKNKQ
ncbi:cation:proton antiporter [Methanothermococcus okinawensis]|uniref:Sodium/hydrogen exchanger n=1 Tax=Methanothermococcus okinawensis (strain DSM 14208 / JCM 11175 / IH1) TaxID=647113 RepID=F8AND1_METOI|nr:sodium:proton antiporter [Methanothermococcus okinawensis]AEH06190.1 sodium/hydrogen exchanger [Methanothermococcus okinawensis IH1]